MFTSQIPAWVSGTPLVLGQTYFGGSATCNRRCGFIPARAPERLSTLVKHDVESSRTNSTTTTLCLPSVAVGGDVDSHEHVNDWNGSEINTDELVSNIKYNQDGLVAAIAQQYDTNEVLMMAWMNKESIIETMKHGRVVYYSRSRQELWRKGDTSGQVQNLKDFIVDCDRDTILLKVDQIGVACHTGRRSCFYFGYRPPYGKKEIISDVLIDPKAMYGDKAKK